MQIPSHFDTARVYELIKDIETNLRNKLRNLTLQLKLDMELLKWRQNNNNSNDYSDQSDEIEVSLLSINLTF